jgi:TolC family type I secretion outer membrane protein
MLDLWVSRLVRGACLAGAVVFLVSGRAGAEPLALESCVELALRHNLEVARAEATLTEAKADVTGSRSSFFPRLSLGGSWTTSEQDPYFNPEIGLPTFPPNEFWSGSVNASQILFDGMGVISSYKAANQMKAASQELYRKACQDVMYETERRYFDLMKKQALHGVQEEALKLSEEQLRKTRAMKELGASTQADVFKSEVERSNNRLELLRAERDVEVARAFLATYLGRDPREPLEIVEVSPDSPEPPDPDAAAERAIEMHPSLQSARWTIEADRLNVRATKANRWPELSLFGNYNYSDVYFIDGPSDENTQWNYGVRLSMTLFDGLLTKSNIRRAESNLVTSTLSAESAERDVLFGVQQATLEMNLTKESIVVAEEAVRSSEEDLRLAEERYKVGEGTILEVIDAQVNLTRARTNRVNAVYDHRLALSALRNAIGDVPVPELGE